MGSDCDCNDSGAWDSRPDWDAEELWELKGLVRKALAAANPNNEPWRCPHFAALAEAVK